MHHEPFATYPGVARRRGRGKRRELGARRLTRRGGGGGESAGETGRKKRGREGGGLNRDGVDVDVEVITRYVKGDFYQAPVNLIAGSNVISQYEPNSYARHNGINPTELGKSCPNPRDAKLTREERKREKERDPSKSKDKEGGIHVRLIRFDR